MKQIKVYEFVRVNNLVTELIKLYRTNDLESHKVQIDIILSDIKSIFEAQEIDVSSFIEALDDVKLTKKKANRLLNGLRPYVEDFELPSTKQMDKLFRKVKKLKTPNVAELDTKALTYLGWNDNASNRKYIVYRDENGKLQGIFGDLSPNKVKGFCKICNQESDVSLFLNKTKHNKSEGTYTKKGDYICHDSFKCNQNLDNIDRLYDFINTIQ